MPIIVNLICENNMLTDMFTHNSVLIHAQISSVGLALLYASRLCNAILVVPSRNVYYKAHHFAADELCTKLPTILLVHVLTHYDTLMK